MLDGPHPHLFLQCHVISLAPHSVKLSRSFPEHGINDGILDFDYLVYALGSVLPGPSDLWGSNVCGIIASPEQCKDELIYQGEKTQGIDWLKKNQKVIEDAPSVLVVGGGALGVRKSVLFLPNAVSFNGVIRICNRHRRCPSKQEGNPFAFPRTPATEV